MRNQRSGHGISNVTGFNHLRLGNFGRLLDIQTTWADDFNISNRSEAEHIASLLGGPGRIMHDRDDSSPDSSIPAAYTFLAQFIDHDITLEARTRLDQGPLTTEEINNLPNFRSASLDLDSVYGFGPDVSPHLYDLNQRGRLLVGSEVNGVENPNDLPRRGDGAALLGDPRNDENLFLSQLHLLFLRLHNRILIGRSFEEAQREARYHYQYIVLHDFLRRVCDQQVYEHARCRIEANDIAFFNLGSDESGRLRMPVEFSAAAYRFGHSMVRSHYPVNEANLTIEIFDERRGTTGFRPVPPELTVDWNLLLDVGETRFCVRSKALDHLLADELVHLPPQVAGRGARPQDASLAFRNLLRGYVLGLPSGQGIATELAPKYNITVPNDLQFSDINRWEEIDQETRSRLEKHTPLFFYLMREAGVQGGGNRLGSVGSAILMEVFGAMLLRPNTFITDRGNWEPDAALRTLADLVRFVSS